MKESDDSAGTFTLYCDEYGCETEETFSTNGNWQKFISKAKAAGWRMKKEPDCDWFHTCPGCAKAKGLS